MTNAEALDRIRAGLADTVEEARVRLGNERWLPPAAAATMQAALTKVDEHLAALDSLLGALRATTSDAEWVRARDEFLAGRQALEQAVADARRALQDA
jgi:hypothetical protein